MKASAGSNSPLSPKLVDGTEIVVPSPLGGSSLRAAREWTHSEQGQHLYACRAGIEGTLPQGVRAYGLRWSRYRGLAKTHVQHMATAAQRGGRIQTDDGVYTDGDRGKNVGEKQSRGRTSPLSTP